MMTVEEKITFRPVGGPYYTFEYMDEVTPIIRDSKASMPISKLEKIVEAEPHNMAARLELATQLTQNGEVQRACDLRFSGCNILLDVLPDDEDVVLDWDADNYNKEVVELLYSSGVDHYMYGDYEYAAGLLEMALMLDEEDHFSATLPLAYCYVALGEWELLEETLLDIPNPSMDRTLLDTWAAFLQDKCKSPRAKIEKEAPELLAELTALEHPVDEKFILDIQGDRPSKAASARELWVRTEGVWQTFPDFIEALKR